MTKRRIIVSLSAVAAILLLSAYMLISSIANSYDYKNNTRIFDNTDDLNFLDEYVVEENPKLNDIFNQYEGHLSDCKNITIDYNGETIYIYAYIFESPAYCLDYVEAVSGNNYQDLYMQNDGNLSMYYYEHVSLLNIFQSEKLLVFSNSKAYVISAKISDKKFNQFIDYFMKQLPLEVQMTY